MVAGKLKVGEVSPLVDTGDGFVVIRCDRVVPGDPAKSFEAEKAGLLAEVVKARINREIPKLFKELKGEAKPVYHLTLPESGVVPRK